MKSVGVHVASDALALGNLAGAHPAGRGGHRHGRRPLVRQHAGAGRQPIPLRAPAHAGGRAGHAAGAEGLDRTCASSCRRRRGCTSGTSSPSPTPTAAARSTAGRTSFPRSTPSSGWRWTRNRSTSTRCCSRRGRGGRNCRSPDRHAADRWPAARRAGHQPDHPARTGHRPRNRRTPAPLGFIVTGMGGPYLAHVLADLGLDGMFPVLQHGDELPGGRASWSASSPALHRR